MRDGLVSVERAMKDYGVIIEPKTFEIDKKATGALRKKMKAEAKA